MTIVYNWNMLLKGKDSINCSGNSFAVQHMPNINKVLYNVDQTTDTLPEERRVARKNIGYHELVGRANDSSIDETTRIAPLNNNGYVPAEYLPPYVDDVVEGYYHNGKFYKESTHTTEISGESDKIYVDISDPSKGVGYRWTGSAFILISGQDTFSFVKIGNKTISADQVMDTLEIASDTGIKLTVDETNDKFTIGHENAIQSGTIGNKGDQSGQVSINVPWADYDAQGHITGKGTQRVDIAEATTGNKGLVQLTNTVGNDDSQAITPKGVSTGIQNAIGALDGNITGSPGESNTLTAFSETDGVVNATFGPIKINANQVTAGTLPVSRGGTGQTNETNIVNKTIQAGLGDGDADVTDNTDIITSHVDGYDESARPGLFRRKATYLWNYIKSKLGIVSGKGGSFNPVYFDSDGVAQACDPKASVPYIDMSQYDHAQSLTATYIRGQTVVSWVPWTSGRREISVSSAEDVEDAIVNHGLLTEIEDYYHALGVIPYVCVPGTRIYCYESEYMTAEYGTVIMVCVGFEHKPGLGYNVMHTIRFGRSGGPGTTQYVYKHTTTKLYDMDISGTYDNSPNTVYFL